MDQFSDAGAVAESGQRFSFNLTHALAGQT
ncbi:MAG: hypothetical protein ACJA00_005743, partial [Myxococcota bacterium]